MTESEYRRRGIKKNQRRKKRRKIIFFIVLPILFIATGALMYTGYLTWKLANATEGARLGLDRGEKSELRVKPVDPGKDNISVLFLGVDDGEGGKPVRSDAMILATFNKRDHSIKMISIPRDSRVKIPGKGKYDKITHAHAFGGVDLSVETVENLFDIPIDYYVKLNFMAFVEMIDTLGGIEVDVPFSFTEQDSAGNMGVMKLKKGKQTLNGEEALAFVRMRKQDPEGDIGRGKRQALLVEALIDKAASIKSITKYDDLIDDLGQNYSSNLSFGNIVALQSYAKSLRNIESYQLPGEDNRINGSYYYELDEDAVDTLSIMLQDHLDYDSPNAKSTYTKEDIEAAEEYRINAPEEETDQDTTDNHTNETNTNY